MEGIINVAPEKLIEAAGEFGNQSTQLQGITTQMMDLITAAASIWTGDAAAAYITKFKGLQDDMDRMFRMVQEHSSDLQEMATAYNTAETNNAQTAEALNDNIII